MPSEKLIKEYMSKYSISRDDALELIAYDNGVDKMSMKEVNADLTAEQKKAIKANTKTTSGKPKDNAPKERKVDADKVKLINLIWSAVMDIDPSGCILNPEREITFDFNGANYSVTLTKHRPKK